MSQSLFDKRTRLTTTLTVLPQCLLHCDKFLQLDDLPNYLNYLAKPFLLLPLPLGVVKIRSNWPHWHVRILSGQANNKQNLSKIDYLIISQLLISYHHSDVMYKKFHLTAQMLSCSNIVLSSNFDPSNFLAFSWQNLSMPIIFF